MGWACSTWGDTAIPADTEAVVALAFACLEKEQHIRAGLAAELRAAVHRARARLVEAQSADGLIGNAFSTPLAMQVSAGIGMEQVQERGWLWTHARCRRWCRSEPESCAERLLPPLPALHRH